MGTFERVATAIVGVGLVTTLILNGRQTEKILRAGGAVFTSALRTSMGR